MWLTLLKQLALGKRKSEQESVIEGGFPANLIDNLDNAFQTNNYYITIEERSREAVRLNVPDAFLAFLAKKPSRLYFEPTLIKEDRHKCVECKKFFEVAELIHRVDGGWWAHPSCAKLRTDRLTAKRYEDVADPKKRNWIARGRVIKKGDSL